MDPKATLDRWLEACLDDDLYEAESAAKDYNNWVYKGGFLVRASGCVLLSLGRDERGHYGLVADALGDIKYPHYTIAKIFSEAQDE